MNDNEWMVKEASYIFCWLFVLYMVDIVMIMNSIIA